MSCGCGLEWSSKRPWRAGPRLLREILRFLRTAGRPTRTASRSIAFSVDEGYSESFRWHYLVPMTSALWSMAPQEALDFPASYGIEFFANHSMLGLRRSRWRTVTGGSTHVRAGAARAARRAGAPATAVGSLRRTDGGVVASRPRRCARAFRCRRRRDERAARARAARGSLGRRAGDPLRLRVDGERDRPPHRRDLLPERRVESLVVELPVAGLRRLRRPAVDHVLAQPAAAARRAGRVLRHAQPHRRHRSLGRDPGARVRAPARSRSRASRPRRAPERMGSSGTPPSRERGRATASTRTASPRACGPPPRSG